MPVSERLTTTISTTGQVVLPKAIRRALGWEAGTRPAVENTPEGVLPKPAPVFSESRPGDVFGCPAGGGPPTSHEEMDAGVLAEAGRRRVHTRGQEEIRNGI